MVRNLVLVVALGLTLGAAAGAQRHPARSTPRPPTREERTAFEAARPVLEKYCFRCHTSRRGRPKTLKQLNMDGYPFTGLQARTLGASLRRALTASDKKGPTMPDDEPGVVTGESLEKLLALADAFDRAATAARTGRPPIDAGADAREAGAGFASAMGLP